MWFQYNKHTRLLVRCGKYIDKTEDQCPFRLWVSWTNENEKEFQIKSLNSTHHCSIQFNIGIILSYKWLGNHFKKEFFTTRNMSVRELKCKITKKLNTKVSMSQYRRAKKHAINNLEGSLKELYSMLWNYGEEIGRSNLGSLMKMDRHYT